MGILTDAPFASGLVEGPLPGPGEKPKGPSGLLSVPWIEWILELSGLLNVMPRRLDSQALGPLAASLGTTSFRTGLLPLSDVRITLAGWITQAATTSSSLILTVTWQSGGVSRSKSTTALTSNLISGNDGLTVLARIDPNSAVSFSTTYASVGGTVMQYSLLAKLEAMP